MAEEWIPMDRRPAKIPPTRQQVEAARELCFQMMDKMYGVFWHSGIVADNWERVDADPEAQKPHIETIPFWAQVVVEELSLIRRLNNQADEVVRRWGLFFDRFASDVLRVGKLTYSNTPMAIVGMVSEFMGKVAEAIASLENMVGMPASVRSAGEFAKLAREIWKAGISTVGADFHGAYSNIQARLRNEIGKAFNAAEEEEVGARVAATVPTLSFEEEAIMKALRKTGKRMTQMAVLPAAGLEDHGTNKSLLAQMVQRKLIDNKRGKRGRGYGLPEWLD